MAFRMRVSVLTELLLIGGFLGAIWLPLANYLFPFHSGPVLKEKRIMAPKPELPRSFEELEQYPGAYEAFYNDHFGFRDLFIYLQNLLRVEYFGDSENIPVVIGKSGWLFYKDDLSLRDFQGRYPFNPSLLDRWRRSLEDHRDWLKERGIEFYAFFVPSKPTVYPEFMPDYYHAGRGRGKTRMDQLLEYMEAHSDLKLIDLRPVLMEAKEKHLIYYKTDTHFNALGSYYVYRAVMETLAERFPAFKPYPMSAFNLVIGKDLGGDLAQMLGLQDRMIETAPRLDREGPLKALSVKEVRSDVFPSIPQRSRRKRSYATEVNNPDLPMAVVFHDSNFNFLVQFFSLHFRRGVYYWQYIFDHNVVEHEKPDIVIMEFGERAFVETTPKIPTAVRKDETGDGGKKERP